MNTTFFEYKNNRFFKASEAEPLTWGGEHLIIMNY